MKEWLQYIAFVLLMIAVTTDMHLICKIGLVILYFIKRYWDYKKPNRTPNDAVSDTTGSQ
jgi:hypothetical protein